MLAYPDIRYDDGVLSTGIGIVRIYEQRVFVVHAFLTRPVFDEERRRCTAWSKGMAEGGISRAQEAEREEMARIRESKRAAEERQYLAFEQASNFSATLHGTGRQGFLPFITSATSRHIL